MATRSPLLPPLAGLLLVGPTTGSAHAAVLQDSVLQDSAAVADARGWIGIRTDTARLAAPGEGILVILVTGIHQGGPADEGGVLPGDLLVELDGRELVSYEMWHRSVAEMVPGQRLQVTLNRAGSDIETTVVVADEAPASFRVSLLRPPEFEDSWSSLREQIETLVETLPDTIGTLEWTSPQSRLRGTVRVDSNSVSLTLRDTSDDISRQRSDGAAPPAEAEESGVIIRRFGNDTRLGPDFVGRFRYDARLDPVGSVVLGGAWVRTLSSALGKYFGESSGVLIVDVITGSPARRAGFRPGDVIVAVDGQEVTSFAQFRSGLTLADLPVSLTVVRHRERIELTYPAR